MVLNCTYLNRILIMNISFTGKVELAATPYIFSKSELDATGICDLCGKPAPFNRKDGDPYFEEHHVLPLADGGPDVIYNAVALCPNCYRKRHVVHAKSNVKILQERLCFI